MKINVYKKNLETDIPNKNGTEAWCHLIRFIPGQIEFVESGPDTGLLVLASHDDLAAANLDKRFKIQFKRVIR